MFVNKVVSLLIDAVAFKIANFTSSVKDEWENISITDVSIDGYVAPKYIMTKHVANMHFSPRCGYTNNFLSILTNNFNRYILGLFMMPSIFFGIVSLFMILLIFFKILGEAKVGWVSGTFRFKSRFSLKDNIENEANNNKQIVIRKEQNGINDFMQPGKTESNHAEKDKFNDSGSDDLSQRIKLFWRKITSRLRPKPKHHMQPNNENNIQLLVVSPRIDKLENKSQNGIEVKQKAQNDTAVDLENSNNVILKANSIKVEIVSESQSLEKDLHTLNHDSNRAKESHNSNALDPSHASNNLSTNVHKAHNKKEQQNSSDKEKPLPYYKNSLLNILVTWIEIFREMSICTIRNNIKRIADDWLDENGIASLRFKIVQFLFLLSSISALAFTIAFGIFGKRLILNSLTAIRLSINHAVLIVGKGLNTTLSVSESLQHAHELAQTIAQNLADPSCKAFEEIPIADVVGVSVAWNKFARKLNNTINDFLIGLNTTSEALHVIDKRVASLEISVAFLLAIALFQAFVVFLVICGFISLRVKAFPNCRHVFRKMMFYCTTPIFCLLLFLTCLFTGACFAIASFGADFCYNSPDGNVVAILTFYGDTLGNMILDLTSFYALGCPAELKPYYYFYLAPIVDLGVELLHELSSSVENISFIFLKECGISVSVMIELAIEFARSAVNTLEIAANFFSCSTFNPIYVEIVHTGICTNGVSGFTMVFYMQLCYTITGLLMILLRSAWR